MAEYTLEEVYRGGKYNVMGKAAEEVMQSREEIDDIDKQIELCLVKYALLAAWQMLEEGDSVKDI